MYLNVSCKINVSYKINELIIFSISSYMAVLSSNRLDYELYKISSATFLITLKETIHVSNILNQQMVTYEQHFRYLAASHAYKWLFQTII